MKLVEEKSPNVYVIGVDRGFATFGVAVFELLEDAERVVQVDVLETKKSPKKLATLASSDNHRRNQELYTGLRELLSYYPVYAAAAESTSLPRNSRAAYLIGRSDATWAGLLFEKEIPLAELSPQAIKKRLCGRSNATKAEIQRELERWYPGQFDEFKGAYAKGKWEHGFDAAAALVACLPGDIMLMARKMLINKV